MLKTGFFRQVMELKIQRKNSRQCFDEETLIRMTGWLVPSAGLKIPVQPDWCLPRQKVPLAENRFLQAGNGAENTKEKFQAVLYG